jgi:lysozyme family protein
MNIDQAFTELLKYEGGYSNNPADPGGETNHGVTKRVAVANGYTGAMIDLRIDQAKLIYAKNYWLPIHADTLPAELRYSVFDAAVNSGVTQATKWLQRALNVSDDGIIGPQTLNAVKNVPGYITKAAFNGHRLEFMTGLSSWPTFGRGWAKRIAEIMKG